MTTFDAYGAVLKTGNAASPEQFTAIAQVRTINGMNITRDSIESSHHDSTDKWRDFLPGFKDAGDITLDLEWDPLGATHKYTTGGFLKKLDDTTNTNFQLVWPTSPVVTWNFTAHLTGVSPVAPHEDKLTMTATFKVSGKPTLV